MDIFMNSLYHSDMVINTASTLTIDAVAMNKPVVLIKFDGYKKRPLHTSAVRWYIGDYFNDILNFNACLVADSVSSLRAAVNTCLKDQGILKTEREALK